MIKNVLINQGFKLVPVVYKKVWTEIYWDNDSRTQRYKKKRSGNENKKKISKLAPEHIFGKAKKKSLLLYLS